MKTEARSDMRQKIKDFLRSGETAYLPVGIIETCLPLGIQTVFAFLSTSREIDTLPLIRRLLEKKITVALPRVSGDGLSFHKILSTDDRFVSGTFGIREPPPDAPRIFPAGNPDSEIKFPLLVLVPAIAFTRGGERLGKGGGYYDRFLSSLLSAYFSRRPQITLAGVSWSFQIIESLPLEPHDIKVDCLYTENGCILCT